MVKEFLPGIYQITLTLSGFSPGSINVYLIRDYSGYCLIDTGWDIPPSVQSLQEQLAEINVRFPDIHSVIITHCHLDHLGMISRFKDSHHATIYLHKNEMELIKVRFSNGDQFIPLTDQFLKKHGVPEYELTPPEIKIPEVNLTQPDVLLKGGEKITIGNYRLKVLHTPGHTPGHISLYEETKKLLFSGDVLLPTIATNAALHVQHFPNPLSQYLNSLRLLRNLDIEWVLPGHEYIFNNHRARIDELIAHHHQKSNEILRILNDGKPRTAFEVARELLWSPRTKALSWDNLSGWDKRFAVLQTIAHLEEMNASGIIEKYSHNNKYYYFIRYIEPNLNKCAN